MLITNEIVGAAKLARLASLARTASLGVLVDDRANVAALAAAMRAAGASIDVLVEVDVGAHRCGVLPGAPALELARAIAGESGLRFAGLHAYQGAAQHLRRPAERRAAIARAAELALETKALIEQAGIECATVTGAGTGTFTLERDSGVYTELQPGSYVFMDADYGRNERADGEIRFEQSLFVWTTVMSTPAPDRAIVDAGLKAFAVDSGMPLVADAPDLELTKASDEHGVAANCARRCRPATRRPAQAGAWTLRSDGQSLRLDRRRAQRSRRGAVAGRRARRADLKDAPLERDGAAARRQHRREPWRGVECHFQRLAQAQRSQHRAYRPRVRDAPRQARRYARRHRACRRPDAVRLPTGSASAARPRRAGCRRRVW